MHKSILPYSTRRNFLKGTAASLSAMTLSSCGWTLGKVNPSDIDPKNAKKDELYIYTWAGYTDDDLLKAFTEQTKIKVVADVFGSNEEMLAKIQASGGGGYSIIYPSDYIVEKMQELGLIQKLDHTQITGLDYFFPRFQNRAKDPGNQYSIPTSWGTTGLIYNSEKIQPESKDWGYLWDGKAQISKRLTLVDDVREVLGLALKMLGYSYNSTNPNELQQAYQKLLELKPAIASFTTDAWQQQILTGDLFIAMCYSADANKIMRENNKLKYFIPHSGTSLWMDTMVIPKTAPNPDGAYAWLNYILQPDISAEISQRLSFATPNKAAFDLLPQKAQKNASLFPSEDVLSKCDSIEDVGKFAEVYDGYWTKLRS